MNRDEAADLVPQLAAALLRRRWLLATAESCTGGLISAACTGLPGSSDWFERGFVTYSNAAKTELLGVPAALIAAHGAVSEAVARAMADGALAHARAQVSLGVTGVAGPTGGSPGKPVGTVCFGWRVGGQTHAETRHFPGERAAVRAQAAAHALRRLLELVERWALSVGRGTPNPERSTLNPQGPVHTLTMPPLPSG